jgi:hypothetical protein
MFSRLQNALSVRCKAHVTLKESVHQALDDFQWIADDLVSRPTPIAEPVHCNQQLEAIMMHQALVQVGFGSPVILF